jgi:hypothetical protein
MMDLSNPKVMSKLNTKKALMFVVHRKLKEKKIFGKIKKFTGYQNIGMIKINDLQNLHIKIEVYDGRVALVAIQKKQLKILAENQIDSHVTLPFSKGWVRLRLIGDHTSLNFEIKKT